MQTHRVKLLVRLGDWTSPNIYKVVVDLSRLETKDELIQHCQNMLESANQVKNTDLLLVLDPDVLVTSLS